MKTINLEEAFRKIEELWSPVTLTELNEQAVKIAKVKGNFVWHKHDEEDEMFLVTRGELTIRFRDREFRVRPGEIFVVPRGVEHQTAASEETQIVLFEPIDTKQYGDVSGDGE